MENNSTNKINLTNEGTTGNITMSVGSEELVSDV